MDENMLKEMGARALNAKYALQKLTATEKNKALLHASEALLSHTEEILSANEKDLKAGKEKGMHEGLLDRLALTETRIAAMAEGLRQIAALEDPIGEIMDTFIRPNGLKISKVRVPLGVIGIIYESRPNVTADAFGCFGALNGRLFAGICADALQLIDSGDREITKAFMKMKEYVDVLIPRGGAGLIRSVVENSTIPVIETGTGNCHIYVDREADLNMAVNIIINAKTQRIGVCNACESLVIHKDIKDAFLPVLAEGLRAHHVEMRGDEAVREVLSDCLPATEEDYASEYLDYIISMKTVADVDEAIAHINKYNTKHSEAIITKNELTAEKFLKEIDAACVYVNASTRFTDGFEFGFGAEIGISTQKLHARGPMGLKELTSYKYQIHGNGQIRG